MPAAGQLTPGLVQKGWMVHALEVVTVQDVIVVPTNDEYWGKIGFLIMNSVLVEYEEESVPRTPENPKRMLIYSCN